MFEIFKRHQIKPNNFSEYLDDNDPIDHQILQLIQADQISIDIISLNDEKPEKINKK